MRLTRPQLDQLVRERAGCVQLRYARSTGSLVGVYRADEAGMENDPEWPWATVCEDHGSIVCHASRRLATEHAPAPEGWCDECRKEPVQLRLEPDTSDFDEVDWEDVSRMQADGIDYLDAVRTARRHRDEAIADGDIEP